METDSGELTVLLKQWRDGNPSAEPRLFELVLPELRRIARQCMAHERANHTLQATELVGEVYERLVRAKDRNIQDRRHFFAIAARSMRWYLIDYARRRPPNPTVRADEVEALLPTTSNVETAVLVNGLLEEMAQLRPEWCAVVELKYFLGLTDEEAATSLNISSRTVKRHWHDARRWLFERFGGDPLQ
jgi:RNA polymerase sigma-70 factor, ECF subfamily